MRCKTDQLFYHRRLSAVAGCSYCHSTSSSQSPCLTFASTRTLRKLSAGYASVRPLRMVRLHLFASLLIAAASFTAAAENAPDSMARNFMTVYLKPNPAGLPLHEALKDHVSSGLSFQLRALEAAGKIASECDPGLPIYEGDLFTSYAESAEQFKVLSCRVQKATARCSIALEAGSPKDMLRWRDTLVLVKENGHWRVSDVDRSARPAPKLASTEISAMICGVAATCPDAKWPNPAMHRTCAKSRAGR